MIAIFLLSALPAVVTRQDHMKLQLVQVVWRHGDRSPTHTHTTNPIKEVNWTFGGGGFEQLSTIGMRQHFEFGKQLRKRYIVENEFLSKTYNSKEIYVRSSDYNRTIISAMSNLMGMYSYNNNASRADIDYPKLEGWPDGPIIPIPVHTVNRKTDFVAIAHAACKRKDWLIEMLKKRNTVYKKFLKESWVSIPTIPHYGHIVQVGEAEQALNIFQLFVQSPHDPQVKKVFEEASKKSGDVRNEINLWEIYDAWKIEKVHFNEIAKKEYDLELLKKIIKINKRLIKYDNGIFGRKKVVLNGLDMGREIKKLRGGSLANDMNMHMQLKAKCLNRSNESECRWISGLKYYVYSAHDTTVFALLAALRAQKVVNEEGGYPDYTAAVFVELYFNTRDNMTYFKLLYRASDVEPAIRKITRFVPGCEEKDYCELAIFEKHAKMVKPDRDMVEWCEVDPRRKETPQEVYLRALIEKLQKQLKAYSLQE